MSTLGLRLVPDELRELVAPLVPQYTARKQGGETAPAEDRAVFTAVVYVLTSGCAWRNLPTEFGASPATVHRRFVFWTREGLRQRLHQAVLDELGSKAEIDWSSAIVDAAVVRVKKGHAAGPNPVDRGKKGSKLHVLCDGQGLPLAVLVTGANVHDIHGFKPLIEAIPRVHSRRGPRRRRPDKVRADKAYEAVELRRWLRQRGIASRIARKGIESKERLRRHRWKIERTVSWLLGYRRLGGRYERHGDLFAAFLTLAAALICYKKLSQITT